MAFTGVMLGNYLLLLQLFIGIAAPTASKPILSIPSVQLYRHVVIIITNGAATELASMVRGYCLTDDCRRENF